MVLLHPTKGVMDFAKVDHKVLLELSRTNGYKHLFEKPIKKK